MRRPEPDFAALRARMVAEQLERRGISDPRVLEAMGAVPREAFTDADDRKRAYEDIPVQIGWGQTISQPYMVALICEAAAVRPGDRVLDVGTGSGYQAAVLAELAAEVHTIERLRQLAERAREKLDAAGYERVQVHLGDGSLGDPEHAPFDAITVAAAAPELPQSLYDQLVPRRPARHPGRRPPRPAPRGRRHEPGGPCGRALGRVPLRPAGGRGGLLSRFRRPGAGACLGGMRPLLRTGSLVGRPVVIGDVRLGVAVDALLRPCPRPAGRARRPLPRRGAPLPALPRLRGAARTGSPSSPRSCSSTGSSTSTASAASTPLRRCAARPSPSRGEERGRSPTCSSDRRASVVRHRRRRAARRDGARARTRTSSSGTTLSAPRSN